MKNPESIQKTIEQYVVPEINRIPEVNSDALLEDLDRQYRNENFGIKVISVVGGFLASSAFIGFMGVTGIFDEPFGLFIVGCILFAITVLFSRRKMLLIWDTFAVTTFITAVFFLFFGAEYFGWQNYGMGLLLILAGLITIGFSRNYLLLFIATLLIHSAILFLMIIYELEILYTVYMGVLGIFMVLIFEAEARVIASSKTWNGMYLPIKSGLVFSFVVGLMSLAGNIFMDPKFPWMASLFFIALIAVGSFKVYDTLHIFSKEKRIIFTAIICLIMLPTIFAPAISGAILLILLCFLVNYKTGFGLGILTFCYVVFQYYYELNMTLLTKSFILMISGFFFIILYLWTQKKMISDEKI